MGKYVKSINMEKEMSEEANYIKNCGNFYAHFKDDKYDYFIF